MFTPEIHERVRKCGAIAVLIIDEVGDAVPTARALLEGGIDVMELTLRTPAALEAARVIKAEVPEMMVGIGTVLTPAQVDEVAGAGAAFGVAPGVNPRVVNRAREHGLPFGPGIVTPTDIEHALELECRTLKFFPAETSGGLPHLQNIAAPFQHLGVDFIPLGGLTPANMKQYLSSPLVAALGGSWLAKRETIRAHDWKKITANAREARTIADEARNAS